MAATDLPIPRSLVQRQLGGVPETATPFCSTNGTDVTDTTPQEVKAAVTGKRHWITKLVLVNKTAAETPIIVVQDDSGTPVVIATSRLGGLAAADSMREIVFEPPVEVAAGKAIDAKATTATGDTLVTAMGFVEA